jgi:adenine-specific DNA-methyltransferase
VTRPYYEADGIAVHHADALALSQAQPAASVDLIVTDPPYFRVKDEPWDRAWDSPDAFLAWLGGLLEEWRRILKPNGSLYVFASPQMSARVECAVGARFTVLNHVVWRKPDASGAEKGARAGMTRSYVYQSERIIFAEQVACEYDAAEASLRRRHFAAVGGYFTRGRQTAGLALPVIATALRQSAALFTRWEEGACLPTPGRYAALQALAPSAFACALSDLRAEYEAARVAFEAERDTIEHLRRPFQVSGAVPFSDVWDYPPVGAYDGKHPCEKPVALIEHILRASSRAGAVVFDPFCGSGTTARVAMDLGRRAIVGDASAHWCAWTARRCAQLGLFSTEAA